jgi:molybdopterin-containing oxidoreductase family iron-sulfur binding subunit
MSSEMTHPNVRNQSAASRLDGLTGRRYWKSLEELAATPEFQEALHREFPVDAAVLEDPRGRREFLGIMGASLALAGLTACTKQPQEKIVPYVRPPENTVYGRPLYFATALTSGGFARGVLVESHENRPTKIEGNPDHPESLGATDALAQAEILSLYDPDRARVILHLGQETTWARFASTLREALKANEADGGARVRLLTQTVTSPTLARQIEELRTELPKFGWHSWEAASREASRAGTTLAFGEPLEAHYDLEKADVILSLDADFVAGHPSAVRMIRGFSQRRRPSDDAPEMNRLYAVETTPTATGAVADHRLALRPSEVEGLARAVAAGLGLEVAGASVAHAAWVGPLVKDLLARRGAAVVIPGETQSAEVHALAHAMNGALGAIGRTVRYTDPAEVSPISQTASLAALVADMKAGRVDLLIVFSGNPVYDAPADLGFADALDKVRLRVHLSLEDNETSERCHWLVPAAHPLESWGDARAVDGTLSVIQPLIAPLYGGRTPHEVLSALSARPDHKAYDEVREHWKTLLPGAGFEAAWQKVLHDGLLAGSAFPAKSVSPRLGDWAKKAPAATAGGLEIVLRPDPNVRDGRYANNGWLQELPKPLSKLTWENAALVSPAMATRMGLGAENTARGQITDTLELRLGTRALKVPAWVVPGVPDGTVTLHLGYGRKRAGRVGKGLGVDANLLRSSGALWWAPGLETRKTGERVLVSCTQDHWSIDAPEHAAAERRQTVRSTTLAEFAANREVVQDKGHSPRRELSLYPDHPYEGQAWGLSIDLSACVGCNACVVACQSENNIPVVGKDQVGRGREMHWIRVDRYYAGSPENPSEVHHQPVMCMHCENAPCEVVCPVAATVHNEEGLNDMVYNRCVGTRYCSNNCPYKVRRFNFLLYQDFETESLKMMRNPEVTVRSRGVMEKCTYCVQRISRARIDAKNAGRPLRDGEITTACESACPARAITFGDTGDAKSRVAALKRSKRDYGLLAELQTRPRTSYLAAVRNPNPEMPSV